MSQRSDLLYHDTADRKSRGTTPSSPAGLDSFPVPEPEDAAVIGTIIDLGRGALGWNRLPEKEQDAMICAFYLELSDEGVPRERWMDCYRAAAKRRRQMVREGKSVGALAAAELVAEWEQIRYMHAELDKTRVLPEKAASACERCYGKEPHVRHCDHSPLSDEEKRQKAAERVEQLKWLREESRKLGVPKPPVKEPPPAPEGFWLTCDSCGHRYNFMKRQEGDICNYLLNRYTSDEGEPELCKGTMRKEGEGCPK